MILAIEGDERAITFFKQVAKIFALELLIARTCEEAIEIFRGFSEQVSCIVVDRHLGIRQQEGHEAALVIRTLGFTGLMVASSSNHICAKILTATVCDFALAEKTEFIHLVSQVSAALKNRLKSGQITVREALAAGLAPVKEFFPPQNIAPVVQAA